jgi:mRNA interferase MazF
MEINQYEVWLISLDPTIGHEINKIRPCLIISPNEINHNLETLTIAPMTTKSHDYPTRVELKFDEKTGWIIIDQIKTIDKKRLIKKFGKIDEKTINKVKMVIKETFVD